MALGSTQPLTEMSTRNLPRGKKRSSCRANNLAAICEPNVWKYGILNLHDLYRDKITFYCWIFTRPPTNQLRLWQQDRQTDADKIDPAILYQLEPVTLHPMNLRVFPWDPSSCYPSISSAKRQFSKRCSVVRREYVIRLGITIIWQWRKWKKGEYQIYGRNYTHYRQNWHEHVLTTDSETNIHFYTKNRQGDGT
jgi:hypothetical protein